MAPLQSHPLSIVTGVSPGGIGLEVAAGLRQAGHRVILGCRNMERCAAAKAELDGRRLPGSCECRQVDMSDWASIRAFAEGLQQADNGMPQGPSQPASQAQRIATLVNNAGVMGVSPGADGECGHLRPNHYGPYLLTRLLLPLMAPGGRVVTVASEAHRRGSLRIETDGGSSCGDGSSSAQPGSSGGGGSSSASGRLRLAGPPPSNWYAAYARSKLANVLMTAELARQLEQRGSSITTFSVSPGRAATHIFANVPGVLAAPLRWLASLAFQTPAQGARTPLQAALAPELARSELYMHAQRPATAAPAARDADLALQLWRLSNQEGELSGEEDAALWPPH